MIENEKTATTATTPKCEMKDSEVEEKKIVEHPEVESNNIVKVSEEESKSNKEMLQNSTNANSDNINTNSDNTNTNINTNSDNINTNSSEQLDQRSDTKRLKVDLKNENPNELSQTVQISSYSSDDNSKQLVLINEEIEVPRSMEEIEVPRSMEEIEVPRSMVFLNRFKTSKAGALVRCGFDGCKINDENDEWQIVDKEFKIVHKLELHVSLSMHRFMFENKNLLSREVMFPELRHIRNCFIQIIVELQSQNSQSGIFLQPAITAASPRWINRKVCVLTIQFISRCSLMDNLRNLAPLRKSQNRIWITLVSHSTSQGQLFSCTPKELIRTHGEGMKKMEEFCSVHDFVTVAQSTLRESLLGVHISSCSGLYYQHTLHEVWPNYASWLTKRMNVCLTGYRRNLHTTDGALLLLVSILKLAVADPTTVEQVADVMNQIPILLPGVAQGTGYLPALLPGGTPVSGKGPLPKKKRQKEEKTTEFDIFILFEGPKSCRRLKSTAVDVVLPAVKLRNDMLGGRLEVEDEDGPREDLSTRISRILCVAQRKVVFVVLARGSQAKEELEESFKTFSKSPKFGGMISVGPTKPSVSWVIVHDCCQNCCCPDDEDGCGERVDCFHRFSNLMCGLFWGMLLIAGEGWQVAEVQKEMVLEAPGIVI